MKFISSLQNPEIKFLIQLQEKAKNRKKNGFFLIEGQREILLALKGGYKIDNLYFCKDYCSEDILNEIYSINTISSLIEISSEVYKKLAYRDTTEGLLAVAQIKTTQLSDLKLKENPIILVAEALEKPGNIGAILRTADAAKVDAVILANPTTDLFNPNVIRSSVGCLFTNQIAQASSLEVIEFLKSKSIAIFCAILQEAKPYHQQNYKTPCAIVVGTEATGLTQIWRENSKANIKIPMEGAIDSMNVSVAAAILLFEAKRQRY